MTRFCNRTKSRAELDRPQEPHTGPASGTHYWPRLERTASGSTPLSLRAIASTSVRSSQPGKQTCRNSVIIAGCSLKTSISFGWQPCCFRSVVLPAHILYVAANEAGAWPFGTFCFFFWRVSFSPDDVRLLLLSNVIMLRMLGR